MRILYVISGYGKEHIGFDISTELAQEIIARGHSYTIFAPARRREMAGRTTDAVEEGVPVHREVCAGDAYLELVNLLTQPLFKYAWFANVLWRLVLFLRRRPDFDLIYAEGAYPLGAIVYLATRLSRRPFLVNVNGGDFIANEQANYGYARYRFARWMLRRVLDAAAAARAESIYGAENALRLGCAPSKLALVQRNIGQMAFPAAGTDMARYRAAAREQVYRRFQLAAPRLIIAVGRLLPIKGFDDLIRALPAIRAGAGETQILHVGPNRIDTKFGDYRAYLENLARELGVARLVTFAGQVDHVEVRDFLAAADVLAAPSVEEGGTKMVMEAAAVGTPFVGTRSAGTPEWARNWNCGLIVPPRAPEKLAEALCRILSDPQSAQRMGANGLRFAEQFRTAEVATRILGLCDCALRGAAVPPELKQPEPLLNPVQT